MLTAIKAPTQLPTTVAKEIDFDEDTAPAAPPDCVAEVVGATDSIIVRTGLVGRVPVAPEVSKVKPLVANEALLSMAVPEMPRPEGIAIGSVIVAKFVEPIVRVWKENEGG